MTSDEYLDIWAGKRLGCKKLCLFERDDGKAKKAYCFGSGHICRKWTDTARGDMEAIGNMLLDESAVSNDCKFYIERLVDLYNIED